MCCRYWTDESPELRPIVEEMNRSPLMRKWQDKAKVKSYGEIFPTDVVPVIAPNRSGLRTVYPMKWGYSGKSLLMNARSETAAEKPTFRGSDGKKHTGDKYMIHPKDCAVTWLCGLYRIENGLPVFVILTREPGETLRFLHDRMPLIMPEELVTEWIRPDRKPEELLPGALTDMDFEKVL